jgi:cytochrome c biogenesis protein CcdA
MVFSALIMAVMSFSGAKKAVYASAAFIVAVYTSYFLLGAGLINFVAAFPQLRYVLALLALVAGSYEVANSALTYREGCSDQPIKLPRPLTGIQKKLDSIQASLLAKAQRGSTVLSFLAGVLVSFTLLPCSSGPYLVAALMISKLPVVQSLACLSLYNVVFVAPLILISLAVIIGGRLMAAMDIASIKINLAKKYTSLMLGVLLIALSLWIMFSP